MISVVIPTFKRVSKIHKTLDSVLNQDYKDYEVIVVEDGSNDGTADLVKEYAKKYRNLTYLYQNNAGPAAARNNGVKHAKGEIIAFTDDDCVVPSDWLSRLADGFVRYKDAVGVGGYLEASQEMLQNNTYARYERYMSQKAYQTYDREMYSGWENPAGGTNNLAYTKRVLTEVKGFDETFPVAAGEDADIKKRITDLGYNLLYIPVKVEHHQDYYFKGFLKQSYNRGIGSYYYQKKWGSPPGFRAIYMQMLLLPPKLIGNLLLKPQKYFILLDFIFAWQEYRGMLEGKKRCG